MRTFVLALPVVALFVVAACGEPDCLTSEYKAGTTCYPISSSKDAAEPVGDVGKTTNGGLDATARDASSAPADAAVSRDLDAATPDSLLPDSAAPTEPCPGGKQNACGGCEELAHQPGEACDNGGKPPCDKTGTYDCKDLNTTACNAPPAMPTTETCDGVDNDCDGTKDEGLLNACGTCGAAPSEICGDGVDNNCDGQQNEGLLNACKTCGPAPVEVCDGVDNDCDGSVDEELGSLATWYADCDDDGFATLNGSVQRCAPPASTMECARWTNVKPADDMIDCVDTSRLYYPGPMNHGGVGYTDATRKLDLNCDGKTEISPWTPIMNQGQTTFCSDATSDACIFTTCARLLDSQGNKVPITSPGLFCGATYPAKLYVQGSTCQITDVTVTLWCR